MCKCQKNNYLHIKDCCYMFTYENYLPLCAFNESSIFFKASEVFRYGFLLSDLSGEGETRQLYSYHNYYIEVAFGDNYEEIKTIEGVTVDEALERYTDKELLMDEILELFIA